jgi:hypothetical protein
MPNYQWFMQGTAAPSRMEIRQLPAHQKLQQLLHIKSCHLHVTMHLQLGHARHSRCSCAVDDAYKAACQMLHPSDVIMRWKLRSSVGSSEATAANP